MSPLPTPEEIVGILYVCNRAKRCICEKCKHREPHLAFDEPSTCSQIYETIKCEPVGFRTYRRCEDCAFSQNIFLTLKCKECVGMSEYSPK